MDNQLNPTRNGETTRTVVPGKIVKPGEVEKTSLRLVESTTGVAPPIRGGDIIDTLHRSITSFQNIVADVKDVLRGVEADVRAVETIQLIEEPDKRTLTIQRKYRIIKDR
jgi:hypothetical protein